ncbi:MAG: hypothetical protein HQ580_00230 [Planctomycetes bacterium]|nr:hypothetical protein [Planctomycetota bacterium]
MITLRKSQLLMVLAATCVFSTAYGQQNEQAKRQLQFEMSGTIKIAEEFSEIKYVANFHVINDRDLGPWIGAISTTSKWKEISEKQRQFILKLQNDYKYKSIRSKWRTGYTFSKGHTPTGTRTYSVYAVSKEDVRKMAEAVIEWHDNNARTWLEFKKKTLEKNQEIITEAEKILSKLVTEHKQLEVKAEEKTTEYIKTNYEIDRAKRSEILEHARKNMEDLARYMKLANFELIGLKARMDSIDKFKSNGNISDPGTLIKLEQMLIADEIERTGILARRKAYEDEFKPTKELYDVIISLNEVLSQKQGWNSKLRKAQERKKEAEWVLTNLPARVQPLEVYENKIVIMQVKQD